MTIRNRGAPHVQNGMVQYLLLRLVAAGCLGMFVAVNGKEQLGWSLKGYVTVIAVTRTT